MEFQDSIELSKDETLDVIAALEDAEVTMLAAGMLAGAAQVEDARMLLLDRLTEDGPDG